MKIILTHHIEIKSIAFSISFGVVSNTCVVPCSGSTNSLEYQALIADDYSGANVVI